jgi:hypothetical protein
MFSYTNADVSYPIATSVQLELGDIASFAVEDDMVVLTRCTGRNPCGVINGIYDDPFKGRIVASIHYTRFVGTTDNFEPDQSYPVGANLRCSADGKFTPQRYYWDEFMPCVGVVIEPPTETNLHRLTYMWL